MDEIKFEQCEQCKIPQEMSAWYKRHFNQLKEADSPEEQLKWFEKLFRKFSGHAKGLHQRHEDMNERLRNLREREQELNSLIRYRATLNTEKELLRKERERLRTQATNLGITTNLYDYHEIQTIVHTYQRFRNFPKTAKKLKLDESKVREVVEAWRTQAKKEQAHAKKIKKGWVYDPIELMSHEEITP